MDQMLREVRALGYGYRYYADITNRDNRDENLLKVLLRYIGRFDDEGISAGLVGAVGQKGATFVTETILDHYQASSDRNKHMEAGFYDNALARIKDKRYIQRYLDILASPSDAVGFPLTTMMLARWNIQEAAPYFWDYLDARDQFQGQRTADLVYSAMEGLSFYPDIDGAILRALERKLDDPDKNVADAAKRAIMRYKKKNRMGDDPLSCR